jgi:hypothetical protein
LCVLPLLSFFVHVVSTLEPCTVVTLAESV